MNQTLIKNIFYINRNDCKYMSDKDLFINLSMKINNHVSLNIHERTEDNLYTMDIIVANPPNHTSKQTISLFKDKVDDTTRLGFGYGKKFFKCILKHHTAILSRPSE